MAEARSTSLEPYRFRIGSYGVLHPLGSGGMSSVYRAVHLETGHEVALKVLPTDKARNETILKRFVAEARSAADLQHPSIVQIFDRGSDDGRFYLVLEYVPGCDLHDYVQQQGPLDLDEAVGLIVEVARGLDYAASRGVIHRDVKPSNILRTPEGEAKIIDLGLALRPEAEDERVTREGTTVGTVDYMAPEQARDSRATSFQSDIYSLGCTLHYLLTGLPPFPGGDITEKLTRHARAPVPDVLAARPDLPPGLGVVLRKMMAKKPEDRHASYRELISALQGIGAPDASSVALVPIDEERSGGPTRGRPLPPAAVGPPMPEISLATLADHLLEEEPAPPRPLAPAGGVARSFAPAPMSRRGWSDVPEDAWIWRCVIIGAIVIVAVIGLDLIIRPFPTFDPVPDVPKPARPAQPPPPRPDPGAAPSPAPEPDGPVAAPAAATEPAAAWREPADSPTHRVPRKEYAPGILAAYLPPWAREPIPLEVDGPRTVVRRAPDDRDAGAVSTLRQALDVPRGVVEIADVGPFTLGDTRIPGEARIIRSRPGYRAVVRIEGARDEAVRSLPGVFNLEGRSLILESLDIVVNVRDLGINQDALFRLAGGDLTLRDCTVTIYNPLKAPFAFLRSDGGASRTSRVRLEDCLIRGDVSTLLELGAGRAEVVALRSVLASDGAIARTLDALPQPRHALSLVGSALACRGPMIDLAGGPKSDATSQRLAVKAFDTVFGRIGGPGIASLIHSDTPSAALDQQLDWTGAGNLFAGWLGFYSTGPDHEVRSRALAAFRSTWNGESESSREAPAEWPATPWIAEIAPSALRPVAAGWEGLLDGVAEPRSYLKSRTLFGFAPPAAPTIAAPRGPAETIGELTFDADAPGPWGGDLGAFLRANAAEPDGRLRVRVVGSGARPISPVRLARGSTLEIRVEQPPPPPVDNPGEPERPPLTFEPAPDATGDALFIADGGWLAITGMRLRVEAPTAVESLILAEDGSLALRGCELSVPGGMDRPPVLVSFRAPTTRPRHAPPDGSPLDGPADRPACVLEGCVLATTGDALHAEVGMGVVSLSGSAIGARGDAITLTPSRVARSRFLADLRIDGCTIATGAAAVRVGAWPGEAPGPDRPWLVASSDTAYVDLSERTPRESVLCRADAEDFAQGRIFWRQDRDAVETWGFAAGGDGPLPNRNRDVVSQWVDLWGTDHVRDVTGPRPGSSAPSVRLLGRPRPGRVEPSDLQLDPNHPAFRSRPDLGPDPSLFGTLGPLARRR
ncbi:serine/threonine-protein kinase [Paludisphaera sp.]|uniref:serine/threonine-protein kinase n=1 Tax=Paludisphaera sp. TaxID=2017432 RepID=UPI00301C2B73